MSQILEAEEMTRARYKAAKERILKMSIYDQKSLADTQAMISQFFYLSGIYNHRSDRSRHVGRVEKPWLLGIEIEKPK